MTTLFLVQAEVKLFGVNFKEERNFRVHVVPITTATQMGIAVPICGVLPEQSVCPRFDMLALFGVRCLMRAPDNTSKHSSNVREKVHFRLPACSPFPPSPPSPPSQPIRINMTKLCDAANFMLFSVELYLYMGTWSTSATCRRYKYNLRM